MTQGHWTVYTDFSVKPNELKCDFKISQKLSEIHFLKRN